MLEVSSVFFVQKHQIDPILNAQSVVNVLVRWRQLDTVHVHSDRDHLTLIRASVHDFVLDESISLSDYFGAGSESFLPDKTDFHAFDFDFDKMEADFADDDVLEMVELFIPLKFDVKTVLNTDFHFHGGDLSFFD